MIRALLCLFFLTELAWGHQQKEALTSIAYNDRNQSLEVVHRLYLHDAEEAARRLYGAESDLNKGPRTGDRIGRYVVEHFALRGDDGKPLPLDYVGHEIEGKYFWIYQEIAVVEAFSRLEIYNTIFFDVWPSQANLVNLEIVGKTKSVSFRKGDEWHVIRHNIDTTKDD